MVKKQERVSQPKQKNDPMHAALVRELRDRYLEAVNSGAIPLPESRGKYDVSRRLEIDAGPMRVMVGEAAVPLLEAA